MAEARVVDTNVLYVASAADPGSPFPEDGSPVDSATDRDRVLFWLRDFEVDPNRLVVIDWDWRICGEYLNKKNYDGITEQDYGWLAIMSKRDRDEVVWIGFDVDNDGTAILPSPISDQMTDQADKKMVAGVIAASSNGHDCQLTVACDTDWIDVEHCLKDSGIKIELLIEGWLRAKWHSMRAGA